jgi:hypothetical protein
VDAPGVTKRLDQFAACQGAVHQRHARQRHTLAGLCGLDALVGEVQADPTAGLQLRWRVALQPVVPADVFGAGLVVVFFQQCVLGQVGCGVQRQALHQGRAGHGRQHFVEQAHGATRGVFGCAAAQGQVDLGLVQIGKVVCRRDAHIRFRLRCLKSLQTGQQPQRCKRREGGDADRLAPLRIADLAHRGVELRQLWVDHAQQRNAGGGQLHMPGASQKQRRAQLVFQAPNLAADGGLGQVQFFSGGTKVQAPRDGLKGAQRADGQRAVAGCIHVA